VDLQQRLDRAIGTAPDDDHRLDELVASGRRVLRRRRVAVAAAGLAAVVAVSGGVALSTSTSPESEAPPVAVDPTPTASSTPPRSELAPALSRVHYRQGAWVVDPAVEVLERIDEPYDGLPAGQTSIAVAYRLDGRTTYAVRIQDPGHGGAGADRTAPDGLSLEAWALGQRAQLTGNVP
jgi:hypothetical protein